jgi:hypothetical protein
MAASACSYSLARSVCTAKFKVPTLTCCVLVWNGGGGVAIKEAWKEWHPTKNVLNPANVESRYRGWLVKLFLIPFDSMVPEKRRRRSSKALKKTMSSVMSSGE